MSAKHQKQLFNFVERLVHLEISDPEDQFVIEDVIYEAINCLQALRIRELQELKLEITEKENQLRREKEKIETIELRKFDYCYRIITDSIQKRRESHRKPNYPISKNLLDHGVYWAGHKHVNKQRPDELPIDARVIRFEKNGLKALTYQNDRGQLLSLFDTRVFLGLHKLWERNHRQKEFSFHDWELLDIINLGKSGKHYEMLEESLKTLYATSVVMQEFYDRGKKKQIITEQFHLIQSRGEDTTLREDGKIRTTLHRIQFSDYLQGSLEDGYMNFISLAMLEDLQTDTAQALYLLMNSMILNKEGYYELPVDKICEHIGIEIDQRPSRIKTILSKACDQLIKTEIISDRKFHTDSNKTMYLRLYPTDWFRTFGANLTPINESEQMKLLLTP